MSQVKKFSQCKLRDKKHQYFSIVSLPTDSVIVDHAVIMYHGHVMEIQSIPCNLTRPRLLIMQMDKYKLR
jgi:hypothetical protein